MVESVYWILYQRISIAPVLDEVNVIQQKELVLMMRRRFKARKKINRVDTLLQKKTSEEDLSILLHLIYCGLLTSLVILFVVFYFQMYCICTIF